jgi:hypothetical protein
MKKQKTSEVIAAQNIVQQNYYKQSHTANADYVNTSTKQ